jgi:hypothetical protein
MARAKCRCGDQSFRRSTGIRISEAFASTTWHGIFRPCKSSRSALAKVRGAPTVGSWRSSARAVAHSSLSCVRLSVVFGFQLTAKELHTIATSQSGPVQQPNSSVRSARAKSPSPRSRSRFPASAGRERPGRNSREKRDVLVKMRSGVLRRKADSDGPIRTALAAWSSTPNSECGQDTDALPGAVWKPRHLRGS